MRISSATRPMWSPPTPRFAVNRLWKTPVTRNSSRSSAGTEDPCSTPRPCCEIHPGCWPGSAPPSASPTTPRCCIGRPGAATRTASGLHTGTPRWRHRPASGRTIRGRPSSRTGCATSSTRLSPTTTSWLRPPYDARPLLVRTPAYAGTVSKLSGHTLQEDHVHPDMFRAKPRYAARDHTRVTITDRPTIHSGHAGDLAHGTGTEYLLGGVQLRQAEVAYLVRNGGHIGKREHGLPGDALRAGYRSGGDESGIDDDEQVGGVGLRDEAPAVEHHSIVGSGGVRLHFGQDGVEQVVVVDLRVEHVRGGPAHTSRDQAQPGRGVHRFLELGQHDQGAPGRVEPGVHATGQLNAPGQRESYVDTVGHSVGPQGFTQSSGDVRVRRDRGEAERGRGTPQPGKVFAQCEDLPVIEPQAFPHGVAALNHRVERRDSRLVAVTEYAVNPVE